MSFRDQIRQAWLSGELAPDGKGWDNGRVEPEPEPADVGSHTPPAKDRDGVQVEIPDIFTPEDVERVASMWMRQQVKAASMDFVKLPGFGKTLVPRGVSVSFDGKAWVTTVRGRKQVFTDPKKLHAWLTDPGWLRTAKARTKTAGEVRFIKDRSGDEKNWGWGTPGPSEREMHAEFKFKPGKLKPLAASLRATLMALGHVQSAYQTFTKIKSATISPDGNLGGKGYIQKITEMRRAYMNVSEALSALSDTLYDEINAPHWNPAVEEQSPREREEVRDIMEDVEEIKQDPEEFAKGEEAEMDAENAKGAARGKTAFVERQDPVYVNDIHQVRVRRVAEAFLRKTGDAA